MKIAVQIYGHLRTFEQCAPKLKEHLLDLYDCDVFIHTWDKLEHNTKTWYHEDVRFDGHSVDDGISNKINSFYKPKSLKIESQNFLDEKGHLGNNPKRQMSLLGIKYMTYSKYQSNILREEYQKNNNVQYDHALVIRPDIMLLENIVFSKFKNEFEFHNRCSIHFALQPQIELCDDKYFHYPRACDCFYLANPDVIGVISKLYLEFDKFYRDSASILPDSMNVPEVLFFEYLHHKGIIPREYLFRFKIKRKDAKHDVTKDSAMRALLRHRVFVFIQDKSPRFFVNGVKQLLALYDKTNEHLTKLKKTRK